MSISTDYNNRDLFIDGQLRAEETVEKDDSLGKDAFLTMMVAQLKNQDPLNPMDGTDFTAQLAQFSSLEQQISMNTSLESILDSINQSSENENLFDYMGKEVVSDGNPVTVAAGQVVSGGAYEIKEDASLNVIVYDSEGTAVRLLSSGEEAIRAGTYNINWDGKDNDGFTVRDGKYTYGIIAKDSKGAYVDVETLTSGIVSGITAVNGKSYFVVDDNRIDPQNVQLVRLPGETG